MSLVTRVLEAANRYVFGATVQGLRDNIKYLVDETEVLRSDLEFEVEIRSFYETGFDELATRLSLIEAITTGEDISFYSAEETQKVLESGPDIGVDEDVTVG